MSVSNGNSKIAPVSLQSISFYMWIRSSFLASMATRRYRVLGYYVHTVCVTSDITFVFLILYQELIGTKMEQAVHQCRLFFPSANEKRSGNKTIVTPMAVPVWWSRSQAYPVLSVLRFALTIKHDDQCTNRRTKKQTKQMGRPGN